MNGSFARFRMKTVLAYLGKSLWAVYLLNAVINNPMTVKTIIKI